MVTKSHILGGSFAATAAMISVLSGPAFAVEADTTSQDWDKIGSLCKGLPSYAQLKTALDAAQSKASGSNGGFGLNMWGTVVNRDGFVCAVAFTGADRGSQWPGSRVISAQKANTANAFSLPTLSLSTANLYSPTQPGGSLFGLQESNPVDFAVAYGGPPENYGQANDPMVGRRIGGINVFGGGLALYNAKGTLIGAVGVSGDTSCADHNISWKTRHNLVLDYVPGGVGSNGDDNINYIGYTTPGTVPGDFVHPVCAVGADTSVVSISMNLPPVRKLGQK
jgi:uncharacterized protein GlcG (DUF336 family)